MTNPEAGEDVPRFIFDYIPRDYFTKIEVTQFQKARLYFDQKFVKLLSEGVYYFWNNGTKIDAGFVDTRLLQMDITGQEMMTYDKVALRINFVCHYKICDYLKIHTEIDDFEEQMHIVLQLALREYIGKYRLDEILENKEQISDYVLKRLKEKEKSFFVEIFDAGVKDIILPGDIRDIMNTVLIAEKRAQANVITRREEVASTRSLLNTAKLMEENQTLYKLKELEHLEKICENVGNITVSGGTDLLSQLTKILKGA
jgi:regulator of protease activity HflC (stomatin/prohibitin superfamily)